MGNTCSMSAYLSPTDAIYIYIYNSDHDPKSKTKTRKRMWIQTEKSDREKTEWGRFGVEFPSSFSLWLNDPWFTDEELCTRLHGTKGAQDSSRDKNKKKPPKEPTCLHPSTTRVVFSCFFISSFLSHSPKVSFFVVTTVTSAEFGRLCCTRGRRDDCSSLSFSSIDLVGAQMEIFFEVSLWDLPMRPLKLHFRELLPRLRFYRNNPHLSPCTEKGHTARSSDDQNNLKLSFFRWLW